MMSNPFDQFDVASERNPFDQFDAPAAKKKDADTLSRTRAAVAGVNRGFFSDLIGLPVDTAANVIDLGKMGLGAAYQAVSGKTAPDALLPYDRSKVPGSAEWLASRINDVGMGGAINNPNPEDAVSRVLHSGGRTAGASVSPVRSAAISLPRQAANAAGAGASGIVAGTVAETSPEYAGAAGMATTLAMRGAPNALKQIVRGGEAGRRQMAQRVQDLKDGGIDEPSVGLASGNRGITGLENILAQTPFSAKLYENASLKNIAGMQGKTNSLRDSISDDFGPVVAGEAIQGSIKNSFVDRFKTNQSKLYDVVDKMIPGASKTEVKNTANVLARLTSGIDGAPNIGDRFINGRISDINDGFRLDTGLERMTGTPRSTTVGIMGEAAASPRMNAQNTPRREQTQGGATAVSRTVDPYASVAGEGAWKPSANPSLPYAAVSKLRTEVGNELNGNMLTSDVPRSQWKQLYGSLSDDIGGAAAAAGPKATEAWGRANTYTKRGIGRIEDLESLANRNTPESAFKSVSTGLNSGPTSYERLRGALTPEARQKVVATIVDEMGMAKAGQQGADVDTWSPRTFLTNYAKLNENGGGKALFKRLPGGEKHAENLASIAKTAEMVGDSSKVWANPSGTAPALSARGTMYTLTAGAFLNPMLAGSTAAGLVGANQVSQRLLLNPKFVNWLAKAPEVKPEQARAYAQRLIALSNNSKDAQFQQDVVEYLRSVEDGQSESEGGNGEAKQGSAR